MTYELAKQLKDAGFPQIEDDRYGLSAYAYCGEDDCDTCTHELHLIHNDNDERGSVGNDYSHRFNDVKGWVKSPTLSELIKACDDNLVLLRQFESGEWEAVDCTYESSKYKRGAHITCTGDSIEEVVALFWLKTNTSYETN